MSYVSDRHGVHTIPKGECAGCGHQIVGQIVIAMGKNWHPEHYICCQCGQQLGNVPYFERGGKPYCERDYQDLFLPRCAFCDEAIKDRCVHALGKVYHTEHFVCAECESDFGIDGYYEKDGVAYCKMDYLRLFGPKCHGCKGPVQNQFISALGHTWDRDCFVCTDCHSPFLNGTFFEWKGMPLCEKDYHLRRGSVCCHCNLPIHGRCVIALGKHFHPEHFQCSRCRKQLTRANFKQIHEKAYCQKCSQKLIPPIEYVKQ
ncbi:unnamed protein product [Bursaphelenchus okinawaensis]|uniref:LIM zinc-binding domain-containing protein n=1 Tax=Bursaphelenchus okinawaensis TaxID=465554 RepID=A0A811LQF1_9BILA|nr:unnamed protein product [Bursaphelenchus okinawaensis]CAG9126283.1 unnamed protein product [Bursaphelenchus okinawaensis]